MENKTVRLMVIDEKMNSVILDLEQWQFKQLAIKPENVVKHKSKRALQMDITEFISKSDN